MESSSHSEARSRSEVLIHRLKARLAGHILWDALSIILPPLLAALCAAYLLVHGTWVSTTVAAAIALAGLGFAAVAVMLTYRPRVPQLPQAARLADQCAGAKDHFLTLATVDSAHCSKPLLSRLRREADDFVGRVELTRDFPYHVKSAAYWSTGASLILVALLYILLPPASALFHPLPATQRLREIAADMTHAPRLKALVEPLKTLAAKLEDESIPREEKQAAVEELKEKIAEQQKQESEKNNRDLLSQAADELKGVERQQSASGQEQQKNQTQSGGNLQSNLPKEGEGEAKQSQGGGEGKTGTQLSRDMQQGKSGGETPKEPGQAPNQQQQGDAKGNQPDPNRPGKEPNKDRADKGPGGSKEGNAKNQASEEPPQSAPPAERFYRAGEGKEGLKGARYVTVQLPEEVAADAKGETKTTKQGTGSRARAQIPVSNMPLPAHVPNAPSEKQPMPIEYRGIIK